MGGINGNFISYDIYKKYQTEIQKCYDKQGIANIHDFNFKITLSDGTELNPIGGIGITDSKEFDEIYVESTGNSEDIIHTIKTNKKN